MKQMNRRSFLTTSLASFPVVILAGTARTLFAGQLHFSGMIPPDTREAPTHFMNNGKHYIFTSGTSGY